MDHLGTGASVRRLERIASGDAPEDWPSTAATADDPPPPSPERDRFSRREDRLHRTRDWRQPSPERLPQPEPKVEVRLDPKQELVIPGVTNADDVAGVPRRKRLLRDTIPSNTPLPSTRLTRGLWADVQRHLIQAYEYLCHVGEAKEWIEGCLGEELPFGVVEMEEQLRNGVVLAKLVRVFMGEGAVRKIYEVCPFEVYVNNDANIIFRRRSWTSGILTTSIISSPSFAMSGFPRSAHHPDLRQTAAGTDISLTGFHLRVNRPVREEELPEGYLLHTCSEVEFAL